MANGMTLLGDKQLERVFKTLGDRVQRKVTRQAVNTAATPVLRSARAKVPNRSGLTKKSLGKKVKTYKQSSTVVALVGPKTNVVGEVDGKKHWPAKIAHLVEGGHLNSDGSMTPPHPFLRPAFDQSQGEAMNVLKTKLGEGVEREAKKAAGGGA